VCQTFRRPTSQTTICNIQNGAMLRRLFSHRGLTAAVGAAAGALTLPSACEQRSATGVPPAAAAAADALPIYSKAEVAKHTTSESGIWVVFAGDVYDITSFVQNHPGGMEKIMTAAGGEVEPYWSLYRQVRRHGRSNPNPNPNPNQVRRPRS
jgi:hypothetical protein